MEFCPEKSLAGNASEQFLAPSAPGPEAFPIKANDFSDKCLQIFGKSQPQGMKHRQLTENPFFGNFDYGLRSSVGHEVLGAPRALPDGEFYS
jgi:hypothetical protein